MLSYVKYKNKNTAKTKNPSFGAYQLCRLAYWCDEELFRI